MDTKFILHKGDIPKDIEFNDSVAIDTETMGLNPNRDRLCLLQLSTGNNIAHIVQFDKKYHSPNLISLLENKNITKIFHFARFDIAVIYKYLNVMCQPIFCTKIASKLTRTYTQYHGLKNLCKDFLGIEISKQEQSSDWGATTLSTKQLIYAATDVLYLHSLKNKLEELLVRENLSELAEECFLSLPCVTKLDLKGFENLDVLQH